MLNYSVAELRFISSLSIQKQFRYFGLLFNPFSNSSIVGIDDLKSFGKSLDNWYSENTHRLLV